MKNPDDRINRASALARMWATSGRPRGRDRAIVSLSSAFADPATMDRAALLLDRVARPEDPRAAAATLAAQLPGSTEVGALESALLRASGALAPHAPKAVVPLVRNRVEAQFRGLVIDPDERSLTHHIASTLAQKHRVNLSLLGEPPIGERQARARVKQLAEILARSDVDYVSVDPTTLVSQIRPWDLQGEAERISERLRGLLLQAAATSPQKFIHLNMGRYQDFALLVEVFERVLGELDLMHVSAGITLHASLPDSFEALERLIEYSTARVRAGGAPIKVRIARGTSLAQERAWAEIRGWVPAQYASPRDTDAQFLCLIERMLRPEVAYAARLGVASANLFHLAYAHICAEERGLQAALDLEMLHGFSRGDADAVAADAANPVIILTPVAPVEYFDVKIPYLLRRLPDIAQLTHGSPESLETQESDFVAAATHKVSQEPRRSHAREALGSHTTRVPDSDPALALTREVLVDALQEELAPVSALALIDADALVEQGRAAAPAWAQQPAQFRGNVLRTVAQELESRREQFVTVLANETSAVLSEADAQVSQAVEIALVCAERALALESDAQKAGLDFNPDALVLVAPAWSAPVADAVAGVLSALAAGSATILKPAPQTPRAGQLVIDAVRAALETHGQSTALAGLALVGAAVPDVDVPEGDVPEGDVPDVGPDEEGPRLHEADRTLVAHAGVDTVLITGSYETAQLFTSWRARRERGPRVYGEMRGKNSMIVTPSADLQMAAEHVVESAFAHAGQDRHSASLLILVGSMAQSTRFRDALADAVESLRIDAATHPAAAIAHLVEAPVGENLRVLTELEPGESWLVTPQELDDAGRLWRPGVKTGVQPSSDFHRRGYPIPVLGVMVAKDLDQAIEWQNATDFGLSAGIWSLSEAEVSTWLESADAANLSINTPIAGINAARHAIGGWKNSGIDSGGQAGGPYSIAQLGQWIQAEDTTAHGEIGPRVGRFLDLTATWLEAEDRDWLRTAARSDAHFREVYRTPINTSGTRNESKVNRFRPGPRITIRAGKNARLVEVLRLCAAAWVVGGDFGVSVDPAVFEQLPENVQREWRDLTTTEIENESVEPTSEAASGGIPIGHEIDHSSIEIVAGWRIEDPHEFSTRASTWIAPGRIRILDSDETAMLSEAVSTAVAVLPGAALQDGGRELLAFLREQLITRTEHRYGYLPAIGSSDEGITEAIA